MKSRTIAISFGVVNELSRSDMKARLGNCDPPTGIEVDGSGGLSTKLITQDRIDQLDTEKKIRTVDKTLKDFCEIADSQWLHRQLILLEASSRKLVKEWKKDGHSGTLAISDYIAVNLGVECPEGYKATGVSINYKNHDRGVRELFCRVTAKDGDGSGKRQVTIDKSLCLIDCRDGCYRTAKTVTVLYPPSPLQAVVTEALSKDLEHVRADSLCRESFLSEVDRIVANSTCQRTKLRIVRTGDNKHGRRHVFTVPDDREDAEYSDALVCAYGEFLYQYAGFSTVESSLKRTKLSDFPQATAASVQRLCKNAEDLVLKAGEKQYSDSLGSKARCRDLTRVYEQLEENIKILNESALRCKNKLSSVVQISDNLKSTTSDAARIF